MTPEQRKLNDAYIIIAVLVNKLGGTVEITDNDLSDIPQTPLKRIDDLGKIILTNKENN